jgi:flavin reductase (DIM6/NTAB) family NADH-FMN oxidoreductase RutF
VADGVGPAELKDAFSRWTTGVCLLTTTDPVGRDCGLTVTSVASVSLRPPLALVCVKRDGFLHDALSVADGWAITVLSADLLDLARYTARSRFPSDTDDFSAWPTRRGALSGALMPLAGLVAVECVPYSLVPAGDHTAAIGLVVATHRDLVGREPLLYGDREFHQRSGQVS